MTYLLTFEDREYIKWLFSPESYNDDFLENTKHLYKAKLIKIPGPHPGEPAAGLKFESEQHLILFKLRYS